MQLAASSFSSSLSIITKQKRDVFCGLSYGMGLTEMCRGYVCVLWLEFGRV